MIFAPFIKVNNHGQTTVFACSFLSDETTESFVWLFEQFKKTMPGDLLKMIIIDPNPAIMKAISETLLNTFHRYCIWHILNKFYNKIHSIKNKDCDLDFQKCIWKSLSRDDFDRNWMEIIEKGKQLHDNVWLKSLFEVRSKWLPAYMNHVFSAGMSSSQRAKSYHSFFKRYVSRKIHYWIL